MPEPHPLSSLQLMLHAHNEPFASLQDVHNLRGRRVVVRTSLNVPLDGDTVRADFRIIRALETISYLTQAGARVVLIAHSGRSADASLRAVYEVLREHIALQFVSDIVGESAQRAVAALGDGEVLLLENVRSDPREMQNDAVFARTLASYGDIYINDAFADSHRAHASIVGIPVYLPAYAGLLFAREFQALSRAHAPESPSLCILGGAKFDTKLPLAHKLIERYDHLFIGGALANDILRSKGYEIGTSRCSGVDLANTPLVASEHVLPVHDVVVHTARGRAVKTPDVVAKDEQILDIGPRSIAALAPYVADAATIVWNGPLGDYEHGYDEGTHALARMLADAPGRVILGGGDTVAAIHTLDLADRYTFVSTAGGAMLHFIEHGTLPGIDALASH